MSIAGYARFIPYNLKDNEELRKDTMDIALEKFRDKGLNAKIENCRTELSFMNTHDLYNVEYSIHHGGEWFDKFENNFKKYGYSDVPSNISVIQLIVFLDKL